MNYNQSYYQNNKENILQRSSENQKRRYKEDLQFKLLKRLQARINKELPEYNATIEELLRCSLSFFVKWIKFNIPNNNITRSNMDNIHLHHVRPIGTFAQSSKTQALHWTNIYPIDKHENLSIKDTRNLNEEEQQRKRVYNFLLATELSSNE